MSAITALLQPQTARAWSHPAYATAVTSQHCMGRITSYNVCYTKLLRADPRRHRRHRGGSDTRPGQDFKRGDAGILDAHGRVVADAELRTDSGDIFARSQGGVGAGCRITSYNVCYTKLLRVADGPCDRKNSNNSRKE